MLKEIANWQLTEKPTTQGAADASEVDQSVEQNGREGFLDKDFGVLLRHQVGYKYWTYIQLLLAIYLPTHQRRQQNIWRSFKSQMRSPSPDLQCCFLCLSR